MASEGKTVDDDLETCSRCGKACTELTYVDGVDHVCDECLEDHFTYCDECGEYWDNDFIEVVETEDGRQICERCREAEDEDV